jgi:hypothetical protein
VSRVRPPLSLEGKGCTGSLSRLRWRSSDPTCLWLSSPGCCTRRRRAARGGARGASSAAESGTDRCIRQGGGGEAGPAGRLRRCGAFLTVGGGRSPRGMPCRASHQLEVPSISSLVRGEDTRDAVAAQVVPVAAGSPDSRAKEPEHPRTAGPPRPASTVGGRSTFVIRSPRDRAQGLIVRDSQAAAFWTPAACWWGRTMGESTAVPRPGSPHRLLGRADRCAARGRRWGVQQGLSGPWCRVLVAVRAADRGGPWRLLPELQGLRWIGFLRCSRLAKP